MGLLKTNSACSFISFSGENAVDQYDGVMDFTLTAWTFEVINKIKKYKIFFSQIFINYFKILGKVPLRLFKNYYLSQIFQLHLKISFHL